MNRFADTLRQTRMSLSIPEPARSRVLLELGADLEDLFELHRSQGCSEQEAERRARESLDLSPEALAQLMAVHSTPMRRFLDRLSSRARTRWERAVLMLVIAPLVLTAGHLAARGRIFVDAGPFIWPLLAVAVMTLALGLSRIYTLFLRQEEDLRRLPRGIGAVLGLAGVQLAIGFGGMYVHLFEAYRRGLADMTRGMVHLVHWLHRSAALLTLALLLTLMSALLWLLLSHRAARIAQETAAFLVEDDAR